MNVQFPVLILLLAGHAVAGQQPVQSPSQDETLAKWPWSISLQTAPFKREAIQITLAPKELPMNDSCGRPRVEHPCALLEAVSVVNCSTATATR